MGAWHHAGRPGTLTRMTLADDLYATAVSAAERAIAAVLPDVPPAQLADVAAAAVDAAAPFLDGSEHERVTTDAEPLR